MRFGINVGTRLQPSQRRRLRAAEGKCWSVSGRCRIVEAGAVFPAQYRAAAESVAVNAYLAFRPPVTPNPSFKRTASPPLNSNVRRQKGRNSAVFLNEFGPKNHMHANFFRILAAVLVAPFLGCAGTSVPVSATLAETTQKAIVVLSVSQDSDIGSATHTIFYLDNDRLADRAVLSSVQTVLSFPSKSDFQDRRGHLYVLELPPGQHQIDTWQVATNGNRVFPRTKLEPLKFEVRKGDVLYLGNLHADIELGRVSFLLPPMPTWAATSVADRSAEDILVAEARVPSLKGRTRIAMLPMGSWGSDRRTSNKTDPLYFPVVPKK